mmetsp:Transcript_17301/g.19884  ORF Transcript_17301/g.19884 Transcript_17301/m.19884 type:complete len:86 (+) Transcript_17301:113-370(+)
MRFEWWDQTGECGSKCRCSVDASIFTRCKESSFLGITAPRPSASSTAPIPTLDDSGTPVVGDDGGFVCVWDTVRHAWCSGRLLPG